MILIHDFLNSNEKSPAPSPTARARKMSCSQKRLCSFLQMVVVLSQWLSVSSFVTFLHASLIHLNSSLGMAREESPRHEFHVAPMQCYTNAPLRALFQTLSDNAVLWTEMEKTSDLLNGSFEKRFGEPGHKNIVLQLGGNDVAEIAKCLVQLKKEGYTFDEVNLNCGCPSVESGGAGTYGASLMKKPELTRDLLQSIASTVDCRVSLKCRTAVVETAEELERINEKENYAYLHNYIQHACAGGINHLVLHARPAVLSGLSPHKNRQLPQLNYRVVEQIANDFPDIQVTLNGGIRSISDLETLLSRDSRIASHMAGRLMLKRPLDLAIVDSRFLSNDSSYDKRLSTCIDNYSANVERMMHSKNSPPLSDLCLPLYLVSEQLQEDYGLVESDSVDHTTIRKEDILQECEFDQLYDSIKNAIELIALANGGSKPKKPFPQYTNFKKLSASFKGIVGTKVANKWKRNRSEL